MLGQTVTSDRDFQTRTSSDESGIVTKVACQKVALSRLTDKRYVFSDGILTLPFGHVWLKPIFEHNKNLTEQQVQSNANIRQLIAIEKKIVGENDYLCQFMNMIAQNSSPKAVGK